MIWAMFDLHKSPLYFLSSSESNCHWVQKKTVKYKNYHLWSCQKVCDALIYLLDNIFIRFGIKLYRQTTGIPMGTNCAPLVADLFLFCYERDFMKSVSRENQTDIIVAFNSLRDTYWFIKY